MEQKNEREKANVLRCDNNIISSITKDMEIYCSCLNRAVDALREKSIFNGELSEQIAKELCVLKIDTLTDKIITAYNREEQSTILPFRKRHIREQGKAAIAEAKQVIKDLEGDIERNKINLRSYFSPYERLMYLMVSGDKITFDKERIIADNTVYSNANMDDFIKRAKSLYNQLVTFDKECRALSGSNLFGLSYVNSDAVFSVDENHIIHLDLRHIDLMDFSNRDELLKKANNIKNSKIWE